MANTRAQQQSLINTNLPNNTSQQITPAKHREVETALVEAAAFVDDTNTFTGDNEFQGVTTFGAKVKLHKGSNIASASTLNLGNTGNYYEVTGTTTITGIQAGRAGTQIVLRFQSALTLTHSASFFLPGEVDATTVPGEMMVFVCDSANNWRCVSRSGGDGYFTYTPTITPSSGSITSITDHRCEIRGKNLTVYGQFEAGGLTIGGVETIEVSVPLNLSGGRTDAWGGASFFNGGVLIAPADIEATNSANSLTIYVDLTSAVAGAGRIKFWATCLLS